MQENCIDWINICYTLSDFFWYLFNGLPGELWQPNGKSSSLPVERKYQKRQSMDNYIRLLFNSKYKWNKVIFLQDKQNINAVS